MPDYVISDTHLNHGNIIDHCDRPFESEAEMNERLKSNWNSIVNEDETVLCLGDLAVWSTGETIEWADRLNGDLILVLGNHDPIEDPDEMPFEAVQNYTFTHDGTEFYCEHYPVDVPDDANWWQLCGHHHNNNLDEYPFVDPATQRVNLSVELIDYTPLAVNSLVDILREGRRYTRLDDARTSTP